MLSASDCATNMALLDMSNIPDGMIPGLSDEELNWVTEQSAERLVKELDPNFIGALEENMNDFDDSGILPSELPRIYENREESRKCVVKCFEMYLGKIPEGNSFLFPMPRKPFSNQEASSSSH